MGILPCCAGRIRHAEPDRTRHRRHDLTVRGAFSGRGIKKDRPRCRIGITPLVLGETIRSDRLTQEGSMQHQIVSRDEWLAARKAHLRNEKALTRMRDLVAAERRALPWVKVDKDVCLRHARREEDARRAVRQEQPARHPSLHVRSRLGGGLPELLARGRPRRGRDRASRASRRDLRACLARAARQDPGLSEAHGLEGAMGVFLRQRLQLRLPRVVHQGTARARATSTTTTAWSKATTSCPVSASSTRTRTATSSTPTRATRAATRR